MMAYNSSVWSPSYIRQNIVLVCVGKFSDFGEYGFAEGAEVT